MLLPRVRCIFLQKQEFSLEDFQGCRAVPFYFRKRAAQKQPKKKQKEKLKKKQREKLKKKQREKLNKEQKKN